MFQALGGALLIKSHMFKQMPFQVCSYKLYSSFSECLLTVLEHNCDLLDT